MTTIPLIDAKKLIKIVIDLGFKFSRQKGSHAIYKRPLDNKRVTIPIHSGVTLGKGIFFQILKDLDLSMKEFLDLWNKK